MHACIVMVTPEMAYHGRVDADHLDVVLAQGLYDGNGQLSADMVCKGLQAATTWSMLCTEEPLCN